MTPRAWVQGLAVLASSWAGPCLAQDMSASPLDPAASAVPVGGQAPYQDKLIDPARLPALPPEEDEVDNPNGLPREVRVDASWGRSERGDRRFDERGVAVSGQWDTAQWGSFSLDASVARNRGDDLGRDGQGWRGLGTVWQRNLHLNAGWKLDNGLGVLNTPSLPLLRNQYRFFLPSVPFAGASVDALNDERKLQIQGAHGRAGVYNGTRLVGFDLAPGNVSALGAQWSWSPAWTGAAAFLATQGRIAPDEDGLAVLERGNTRALHVATAWQGHRDRFQINALGSDGDRERAQGLWLDGASRRGRYQHSYGVFRLDPGLSWGALPINNDAQGAYYRLAYQHARWAWSGGLDRIASLSGRGFDGTYATGFARYQASTSWGYGGSVSARRAPDLAYALQLFADRRSRWGQTRVQWDQADGQAVGSARSWQVSLDQAWPMKTGTLLSTSLGYGQVAYDGETPTATWTAALTGSRSLTNRLSLDGNARWTRGAGPYALRGTDLNVGLGWRLSSRWNLAATVFQTQSSQRSPFVLDPLAPDNAFIAYPKDRSVFLTVRYQHSAGRPQGVIGGAPSAPSGGVRGSVFLDDNADGVRAASETGVPNLTVVLDGRYAVRADAQGNFEFPRVAVGEHTVEVQPDNLPLPWTLAAGNGRRSITVTVREDARVDVGAIRPR